MGRPPPASGPKPAHPCRRGGRAPEDSGETTGAAIAARTRGVSRCTPDRPAAAQDQLTNWVDNSGEKRPSGKQAKRVWGMHKKCAFPLLH